ncbi:type II secretion system F family protein, partial [Candidatus Hydrogenedentota bacterium]
MPQMIYRARTLAGEIVEGRTRARDEAGARSDLSEKGLELLAIRVSEGPESVGLSDFFSKFFKPVSHRDLCSFTGQLALMLETGTSLVESMNALEEQAGENNLAGILKGVNRDVSGGSPLAVALGAHPRVFNSFYVSAVKAGETSGQLAQVFRRLEEHMLKREELMSGVKTALIYPIILSLVAFGAVIFLVTYVLPKFVVVFERSRVALPLPTRILLAISSIIQSYWYILIPLVIGFVAL